MTATVDIPVRNGLEELRANLKEHRGSISRIIVKTGFSRTWVNLVLKGSRYHEHVILTAKEVLNEMREEAMEKERKRQELLSTV